MIDEERAFTTFARGLAQRIAQRTKGLDDESARIVRSRASDRVLAGFLTPRHEEIAGSNEDEALARDLPTDEPHEQTSIGLEWLVPDEAVAVCGCSLTVEFAVYVRRIPDVDEALRTAEWQKRKGDEERETELVPVWTRERLILPTVELPLSAVSDTTGWSLSLDQQIAAAVSGISPAGLFLARQEIKVTEAELRSGAYASAAARGTKPLKWSAFIDARFIASPATPGCRRLVVRLVNGTEATDARGRAFVDPNLYAAQLTAAIPRMAHRSQMFRDLPTSYRYDLDLVAAGINCQARVAAANPDMLVVATETVPSKEIGRLEARDLPGVRPTFDALQHEPVGVLRAIAAAMHEYLRTTWQAKLDELRGESRLEAARDAERFGKDEIERFEHGIELLADPRYSSALRAFVLMNKTMKAVGAKSPRKYEAWRLFQIVFIVAQLPELARRRFPDGDLPSGEDVVDILWFAAGGGKTEAFLGLLLWQIFFDRLTGKLIGVAAFLRFPLRLLAFQQLQRLANALAEADKIRLTERIGGAAFGLGYYVGGTYTTPNEITSELDRRYAAGVDDEEPRVAVCPYCGSNVRLHYERSDLWLQHRCTSASCAYHNAPLPIYTVDADCYRFLPSVVVSTVDKFAVFGQNVRFGNLLGRISAICPRHGATFLDSNSRRCEGAKMLGARGSTSATCNGQPLETGPFVDLGPTLLIQDELHLLTEELGTFDAHYETAILATVGSLGLRPWKVIGATATISTFAEHAQHLYLREARQFPAPGPEAFESFYYRLLPNTCGRIFLGVLGIGRKHTPSVSKLMSVIYLELQKGRDLAARDFEQAVARYGLSPIPREVFDRILFYYEAVLTYVLTRKGSDQVSEAAESRVKQEIEAESPLHGELRIETFNSNVPFTNMIRAINAIQNADVHTDPQERLRGVIATNIIGHGVDIERLNLMLFAGFPRLVAEYIQASARVGRRYPGLVFLVITPQSERDRSVYQQFEKFHEYVDRLVDPSAVNRWPDPAMERTAPGILAGYLMTIGSARCGRRLDTVERVQQALGAPGTDAMSQEAVAGWMLRAFVCDRSPAPEHYANRVRRRTGNLYSSVINAPLGMPGAPVRPLAKHLGAMRSLRDVDDPAFISLEGEVNRAALRALLR